MPRISLFPTLAAVSALTLLSGCGVYHEMVGEPRPGTTVTGERHIPVENQQDLAKQAEPAPLNMLPSPPPLPGTIPPPPPGAMLPPPPAAPPQDVASPRPVNPADADPYDYYDQQGHPVAPKETAHVPSPQSSLTLPDHSDEALRKLLPDNRYLSADMTLMAQALPSEDVPMPPAVAGNARNAPSSSATHSSSFFGRVFGGRDDKLSPADKAAENAPYPALSSVPPTPPELQVDRAARGQGTQQLERDWLAAQQDKQELDAEPSSLPPPQATAAAPGTTPASN